MDQDLTTLPNLVLAFFQVLMFMAYGIAQKLFNIKNMLLLLTIVCSVGLVLLFFFSKLFPAFSAETIDPFYIICGQCVGFVLLFLLYRKAAQ